MDRNSDPGKVLNYGTILVISQSGEIKIPNLTVVTTIVTGTLVVTLMRCGCGI